MTRPVVGFVGVVAFTVVAWLGAGAPWRTADETRVVRSASSPVEDPTARALRGQVQRLERYLASPPPMPAVGRNPFQFASPKTKVSAGTGALRRTTESVPALPPATPVLRLIGIAEDDVGGALVRTAMLTSGDQLLMVKIGDRLLGRYVLVSIGTDTVQLKDEESGATLTVALK